MNRFDYSLIPDYMMESIKLYIKYGYELGGFLTSVMSGDLFQSVSRADDINASILPVYVCYIVNECPSGCNGSREIVESWKKMKRIEKNKLEELKNE